MRAFRSGGATAAGAWPRFRSGGYIVASVQPAPAAPDPVPACTRWSVARDPVLQLVLLFFAALTVAALSMNVGRTTYGIKGDEATYVAMALSIAHDRDLAYMREDIVRFFRVYGRGPDGIFLKPGQGAAASRNRLYFAKSYVYPLVAAPFAWIGNLNGLLAFNVLLLAGVFLCLYTFASARLPPAAAALTSTAFLGASIVPFYAVFLAPETFNLALVCFAYFLWLYKEVADAPESLPALLRGRHADLAAATLLGLVVFSKPSNLPLVAPLVALAWWRRRFLDGVLIGATCCCVMAACFGANAWITGEWNYQGGLARKTFYGRFPFEQPAYDFNSLGRSVVTNELPLQFTSDSFAQLGRNLGYFVTGRHFGLAPYFFPGLVIAGWMIARRRPPAPWQTAIAGMLVLSALGLLFLLPNTWSGGGGPLGNRYFLSFYPAFFFLLPAGRSVVPGLVAWSGGVLFVSQVLVGPFVAAKNPWLIPEQGPLRMLPVELTMVNDLPVRLHAGRSLVPYNTSPRLSLYYLDENARRPEDPGIWVLGGKRADIIVRTGEPLTALTVHLSAPTHNRVTVTVDGTSRSADLRRDDPARLTFPVRGVLAAGAQNFLISVTSRDGVVPRLFNPRSRDARFLGVRLRLSPHLPGSRKHDN